MQYHISDSVAVFDGNYLPEQAKIIHSKYTFRHMDETDPPPGTEAPPGWHYHTCYEILYFLRGDADFRIEQNVYTLHPHSLVIIKPGEYHSLIIKPCKRLDRIVLHFTDDDLTDQNREILYALSNVYSIPGTRLSEEILQVDNYYNDLLSGIPLEVLVSQLKIILAFLCNIEDMRQQTIPVHDGAERIISYIHSNLASIHSLDDICQNVHMSRSKVQNLIAEHLQTPVMSYVRTQKCVMAKSLIQKGCPATEAANRCGFADYSSFYRAYKKTFGVTPTRIGAETQTFSV